MSQIASVAPMQWVGASIFGLESIFGNSGKRIITRAKNLAHLRPQNQAPKTQWIRSCQSEPFELLTARHFRAEALQKRAKKWPPLWRPDSVFQNRGTFKRFCSKLRARSRPVPLQARGKMFLREWSNLASPAL